MKPDLAIPLSFQKPGVPCPGVCGDLPPRCQHESLHFYVVMRNFYSVGNIHIRFPYKMRFKDVSAGGLLCLKSPCLSGGAHGSFFWEEGGSRLCRESSRGRTWCGGPAQLSEQQVRGLSLHCLGVMHLQVCVSPRELRGLQATLVGLLSPFPGPHAPGPSRPPQPHFLQPAPRPSAVTWTLSSLLSPSLHSWLICNHTGLYSLVPVACRALALPLELFSIHTSSLPHH